MFLERGFRFPIRKYDPSGFRRHNSDYRCSHLLPGMNLASYLASSGLFSHLFNGVNNTYLWFVIIKCYNACKVLSTMNGIYSLLENFSILLVNMFVKVRVLLDDVSAYKHIYDCYIKKQKTQQRGLFEITAFQGFATELGNKDFK